MIPIPDKILGARRSDLGYRIARVCLAKSGFYLMVKHKEHALTRTGYYMNMPDRNRYPTRSDRSDVFKAGLEFYRETGGWLF